MTNGQLLIGSTGASPVAAGLTGTTNQIGIATGAGSITLSTPQNIHSGASPTFAGMTITGLSGPVKASAGVLSASAVNMATEVTGTLPVANGGTGAASLGSGNLLVGAGTGAVTSLAAGLAGNIIYGTGPTTFASGTPDTAGLVDKSSTQVISGAKGFTNYVQMSAQNELRFADADSSNYVAFKSPATVGTNITWTLPAVDGSTGQVLSTNGSGVLSWATAGGGGGLPAAAGTEAAPAYAFTGNTNTGVFGPASNQIGFSTNGTEKLRIDGNGTVSVGTQVSRTTASTNRGQLALGSTFTQTSNVASTVDWTNGNIQEISTLLYGFGNSVLFSPSVSGSSMYSNPYISDGSSAGTLILKAIDTNPWGGSNPTGGLKVGSLFFFTAMDPTYDQELFVTDGTPGGTALVKDINPSGGSWATFLGSVGGFAVFSANDGVHGNELWASNGTSGGTTMIKEFSPGSVGTTFGSAVSDGSFLYFFVEPDTQNWQLWKTDGTLGGTSLVYTESNIADGPGNMILAGNYLFFSNCTASAGCELWRSDKTGAGTRLFWDIAPGAASTDPGSLVYFMNNIYFTGNYNGSRAIWSTGLNSH